MKDERSVQSGRLSLLLKALLILLASSGMGLAYNSLSGRGIPLRTPQHPAVSDAINWQLHVMGIRADLEDAKRAFDEGRTLFIDARSPRSYAAGHIPGALNLPTSEWPRIGETLAVRPKRTPIITYCGGGSCQLSIKLANALIEDHGFVRTRAFYDGWHAWVSAGYPVRAGGVP